MVSEAALDAAQEATASPSVRVAGVSKSFAIPRHRSWTIKDRLRHPVASLTHDRLEAVRDVSFEVAPGEFFAIVGRNGSGKSTLLRCIAGIYGPDGGEIGVAGRLAPVIELGVGFHPELNASDNVTVAGTLLGLRPAEARRRFPNVIGFAELDDFIEMPLANYSSGMQVRLAFATSFQVDAEVLLFDEVLAVGDALFQRKCLDTFDRLIAEGRTIVYVSHSLDTVRRFADRVLLLDHGRTIALGDPESVLDEYERRNRARERTGGLRVAEPDDYADVVDVRLESEHGDRAALLRQGEQASFRFDVRMRRDVEGPTLGFAVRDADGRLVVSETDRWRARGRGLARAGELRSFSAYFPTRLEVGPYEGIPLLAPPEGSGLLELRSHAVAIEVVEPAAGGPVSSAPTEHAATGALDRARRFADVVLVLARAEFKLRYLDSAIGYVWSLAQPLLMFLVLYTIWSRVLHPRGAHVAHYPLKLLLAIALFTFFTEATGHALPSLVGKGSMLRKIPFPPLAVPLASVLTSAFVYGFSLLVVIGFVVASGIAPRAAWAEMVPLLLLLFTFTVAVSVLVSIVYVSVRDIQQVWVVVIRLLFFLTPVLYPVELAPRAIQHLLMLNPLAVVIVQSRHALIDPSAPSAAAAAGGTAWLAGTVGFTIALLAASVALFQWRARIVAERI